MPVPPNTPTSADGHGAPFNDPDQFATGSTPGVTKGFWHSETNRLLAVIGGILVGCAVLAGFSLTAAVAAQAISGSQNSLSGKSSRKGTQHPERRPGPLGERNNPGWKQPDSGSGDLEGLKSLGGLSGLAGELSMFASIQHGDVVVTGQNGQPETKRVARGAISEVTDATLTIKSTDGFATTYSIAATSKFTIDKQSGAANRLKVGQEAFAVGTVSATVATADRVIANSP